MKERIRDLEKQSGIDVYSLGLDRAKWESKLEKFAQLIVKECAEIATEQGNTAEHSFTATRAKWFRLGAIKSATMIKRTFGVTE